MNDKPFSRKELIEAISTAARPRDVKRTIERTIYDKDRNVVRTEREVHSWTEPGDPKAVAWLLAHGINP